MREIKALSRSEILEAGALVDEVFVCALTVFVAAERFI